MISIFQKLYGIKLFEYPTDIERLEPYFYKGSPTPLNIYNGTPQAKQGVPLEIQMQQLPINELNGTPLSAVPPLAGVVECAITSKNGVKPFLDIDKIGLGQFYLSNLHRCKELLVEEVLPLEQSIAQIKEKQEPIKEPIKENPIIRKQKRRQLPPDSLFWNIFIEIYGEGEFFHIGSKFTNKEWEEKNKIRTAFMTKPKELQTTNQKITLGNIKEMMSEYMISTTTTLLGIVGLSVYYKMPIILVDLEKRIHLPFLPLNTDRKPFILIKIQGKGKAPDHYEVGDESVLKDTFSLASYLRPLRAISTYKRCELDDIAIQTGLAQDLSSKKSKDELYRMISEQLVWK